MSCSYSQFTFLKLKQNKKIETRVVSGSMSPWIQAGATVTLEVCDYEKAKPWDIIIFWREDKLICHILKKKTRDYFQTFPLYNLDYSSILDPPSHHSNFLGVVCEPEFGFIQKLVLRFKFRKML